MSALEEALQSRVSELETEVDSCHAEIERLRAELERGQGTRENEIYAIDRRATISEAKNKGEKTQTPKEILCIFFMIYRLTQVVSVVWPTRKLHSCATILQP